MTSPATDTQDTIDRSWCGETLIIENTHPPAPSKLFSRAPLNSDNAINLTSIYLPPGDGSTIGCEPQPNPNALKQVAAHRKSSSLQQSLIFKRRKRRHYTDRDEPAEAVSNTPTVEETEVADPAASKPEAISAVEAESTNPEVEEAEVTDPEASKPEFIAALEVVSTNPEVEEAEVVNHESAKLEAAETCKDQKSEDTDEMEIKGHWQRKTVTYRRNKYSINRTTNNKSTRRYYRDADEPSELKQMICWWHLRGLCKFGDDCWYSHDTETTEKAPLNIRNILQPFRGWAQQDWAD